LQPQRGKSRYDNRNPRWLIGLISNFSKYADKKRAHYSRRFDAPLSNRYIGGTANFRATSY
jgi:hypothetical protein